MGLFSCLCKAKTRKNPYKSILQLLDFNVKLCYYITKYLEKGWKEIFGGKTSLDRGASKFSFILKLICYDRHQNSSRSTRNNPTW